MTIPYTIIEVCQVIANQVTNCERYATRVYFGWYFEATRTLPGIACTFPSPLPAWLFEGSTVLRGVILYFLCGRIQ